MHGRKEVLAVSAAAAESPSTPYDLHPPPSLAICNFFLAILLLRSNLRLHSI
jgi:hypothetical protein